MEVFAQIVNGFYFLTIFLKSSILDVWQDSQFASEASYDIAEKVPPHMFDRVLNLSLITSKKLQPLVILAKLWLFVYEIWLTLKYCARPFPRDLISTYLLNNENYNSVS